MKKITSILCTLSVVFAFSACENNDHDDTHYLDNSLVEGLWYSDMEGGPDSLLFSFKDNKLTTEYYAHISGMDKLKFEYKKELGEYFLTDSLIKLLEHSELQFVYKLSENSKDSLFIKKGFEFWYGFKRLKE